MMLNDSTKLIFADKDTHFAKQILNIALCESQGGNFHAYNYFKLAANFELTVELTAEFTETKAKNYFAFLEARIVS